MRHLDPPNGSLIQRGRLKVWGGGRRELFIQPGIMVITYSVSAKYKYEEDHAALEVVMYGKK